MTPDERLSIALRDLADDGHTWPCATDPEAWYADDPDTRQAAAQRCTGCPAFAPCGDYADATDQRHGVWAGVDRTKRTPRGRRKETAA